jgi:hypothetical protein
MHLSMVTIELVIAAMATDNMFEIAKTFADINCMKYSWITGPVAANMKHMTIDPINTHAF